MSRALLLALVAAASSASATAAAQEAAVTASTHLHDTQTALEAADFAAADHSLDEASRLPMHREELVRWLELGALVSYAAERLGALETALRAMASLGAQPSSRFPTPVQARLEEIRAEAPSIELEVLASHTTEPSRSARTVALSTRVARDPGRLVLRTETYARAWLASERERGDFRRLGSGETLRVAGSAEGDLQLEYYALAFGPGDSELISHCTAQEPCRQTVRGLPADETALHAGLVVGASALALGVAGLIAAAVLTDGFRGETTLLRPPVIMSPIVSF